MSIQETRRVMESYLQGHEAEVLAEDASYTIMGTGDVAEGRDAIERMLADLYGTAFDARAELKNLVVDDGKAVAEYVFSGRHIGEFAGVAPTGTNVTLPFCVAYDVAAGKIAAARVYFELGALRQQLEAAAAN